MNLHRFFLNDFFFKSNSSPSQHLNILNLAQRSFVLLAQMQALRPKFLDMT